MKPIYLAFAAPLIGTTGQILLKSAMNAMGKIGPEQLASPISLGLRMLSDPKLVLAAFLYFFGFLLWMVILSRLELSKAYPILALSYCLVALASWAIFGEHLSLLRIGGTTVICLGVVMVGFS
jgi:drug/metabolite transporter (DMT)-like permease